MTFCNVSNATPILSPFFPLSLSLSLSVYLHHALHIYIIYGPPSKAMTVSVSISISHSQRLDCQHQIFQTSTPIPSLPDVISILASSQSAPSTLSPPHSSTYPSTSAPSDANSHDRHQKPNLVPVFIEMPADMLTPVAAYLKISHGQKHSFLLESVVGGENLARYSFVGAGWLHHQCMAKA